jgi:S1-C subfamily serine protease
VEFGGKEIKNLYDFTFALRQHRPGETVKVAVLRGGQKMIVDVKLETRK